MKWLVLFCIVRAIAAPYTPSTDTTAVERLSHHWEELSRNQIHKRCDALRAHPTDMRLALSIADELMEEARVTSDGRPLGRIEAMMRPWWKVAQPLPEALFLRARVRRADREFASSLADLDAFLAAQPQSWPAQFLRATVLMSLGRLSEARMACERLPGRGERLFIAQCFARAEALAGKTKDAFHDLKAAIAKDATGNPTVNAWSRGTLAQIAADGEMDDEAKKYFTEALTWDPEDNETRAQFSEFLIDRGKAAEAIALLKTEERNPRLLLRLAIAEKETNGPEMLRHVDALQTYFQDLQVRGTPAAPFEEALFALHFEKNPKHAVRLALSDWEKAREPRDARLVFQAAQRASDKRSVTTAVSEWKASGMHHVVVDKQIAALEALK